MPPSFRIHASAVFCAFAALLTVPLRAQSSVGVIEARVFNAATGSAPGNARVALEGAGREVITDGAGAFRLTGVSAGSARIKVRDLGMAPQKATVSVASDAEVCRDFALGLDRAGQRAAAAEAVTLDAFTVTADCERSVRAIAMMQDLQCCAPGAPDDANRTRWPELGFDIHVGVRGSF